MQRIADQVGGRLVYIVITALIILPVWVATQSHMAGIQEAAPLDLPADQLAASAERSKPASTEPSTVVASMASLPQRHAAAPPLSLRFSGESWVQVVAPDGRSIEDALHEAVNHRTYAAGPVGQLGLGPAPG